ncbi:hypothetical protein [Stieleria varia]|uniref:EF-hand domain-containing protein n=1 Tax=Stieleria varia TaxID=2528005 RepID=A0A5C6B9A7_9BACT|nr:hypothetical protein [Stieleria varia]TWU08222.1 hypothetical protein Pla52n_08040 [Stieleria varia]
MKTPSIHKLCPTLAFRFLRQFHGHSPLRFPVFLGMVSILLTPRLGEALMQQPTLKILGHFDNAPTIQGGQVIDELILVHDQTDHELLLQIRLNGARHFAKTIRIRDVQGPVKNEDVWVGDYSGLGQNQIVIRDQKTQVIVFPDFGSQAEDVRVERIQIDPSDDFPAPNQSHDFPSRFTQRMLDEGPSFHHIQFLSKYLAYTEIDSRGRHRSSKSSIPQLDSHQLDVLIQAVIQALEFKDTAPLQRILILAEFDRIVSLVPPIAPSNKDTLRDGQAKLSKLRDKVLQREDPTLHAIHKSLQSDSDSENLITDDEFAAVLAAAESDPVTGREYIYMFANYTAQYRADPFRTVEGKQKDQMMRAEMRAAELIQDGKLDANVPQVLESARDPRSDHSPVVSRDPWDYLDGKCGHTALAMIRLAIQGTNGEQSAPASTVSPRAITDVADRSLGWAQDMELTVTGEIFDLANVARIASQFHHLDGVIHQDILNEAHATYTSTYRFSDGQNANAYRAVKHRLNEALAKGNPVMLAFDADAKGNPMRVLGMRSHFAIAVHHFQVDEDSYYILKHGWGEQYYESMIHPDLQYDPQLNGYHVVCESELIPSMLGLTADAYYRPKRGTLLTGKSIPKHQQLKPAITRPFAPVNDGDLSAGADQSRIRGLVEFRKMRSPTHGVALEQFDLPDLTDSQQKSN